MKKAWTVALLVLCAVGLPASAAGGYLGASYLSSSAEFDTSLEDFDSDSDSWKIFAGYDLHRNWGVELTYYDFGDFNDTANNSTLDANIGIWDLSVRGILPLGERFELFGRLGTSNVRVEATVANNLSSVSVDADAWELMYGVGAGLKLGKRFGLRAEWEAWDTEDSLEAWSIGAVFRFGGN